MLSACLVVLCGGPANVTAQQPASAQRARTTAPRESVAPRVARANARPLREFFAKLKRRVASGELSPNQNFALTVTAQRKKGERFANFAFTAQKGDARSLAAAKEFLAALQECQLLDALSEDASKLVLQLEAGDHDVFIQAAFTLSDAGRAQTLAGVYQDFFKLSARNGQGRSEAVLFENTKSLASRQQLILVSRLPRAALNKMLAEQSAAAR